MTLVIIKTLGLLSLENLKTAVLCSVESCGKCNIKMIANANIKLSAKNTKSDFKMTVIHPCCV